MKITNLDKCLIAKTKSGIFPYQMDVCLYIADGVLIDTGSGNISKKTIQLIQKEKIQSVAITHVHEDHTGAAAWIKENLNIPVYLRVNSHVEASVKSDIPLYRRMVWGNRAGFIADLMPEFIEAGKYRLDVINAPGHHKDHVVFHEKKMGWLFTGDLYISRRQLIAFKDENISDAINSIKEILELDFDTIFCGHSGVQQNGKEKFKTKLDNFLEFQGKVGILRKDGLADKEIDKRLAPKMRLWTIISGNEWSSLNMIKTV